MFVFFVTAAKVFFFYRPHPKDGEGTVFTGVCLSVHRGRVGVAVSTLARLGWGTPQPGQERVPWEYPRDRTAERALATQQAVCLLRSSRRTFLFLFIFCSKLNLTHQSSLN